MLKRTLRGIAVFLILLLVAVWVLTQPLFDRGISTKNDHPPLSSAPLLKSKVENLVNNFGSRNFEETENLAKVAEYIASEFRQLKLEVELKSFEIKGKTYFNVYASIGPMTPEVIVVGAHYDTAGPFPGADDNASGVAGLLEVGRVLSRTPPPTRVILAAYSLEEPPFFRTRHMGSAIHAKDLKEKKIKVRLMMSLEMLGYYSDAEDSQHFPIPGLSLLYPHVGNFIAVVSTPPHLSLTRKVKRAMLLATPLPVYSINAPREVPGIDFSDHLNFLELDYPAMMITDTAENRNTAYHTERDTADRLDYERMRMAVDAVIAAVQVVAQ